MKNNNFILFLEVSRNNDNLVINGPGHIVKILMLLHNDYVIAFSYGWLL